MHRTAEPITPTPTDPDQLDRPTWLPIDVWPFTLRRHRALLADDPVDLHYTDEGDGPVLVFVHAGMWSFVWRDAILRLRDDFRCVTLDFPGAGLSQGGPEQVDLALFPAIVDRLLDDLGVVRATLVVHDLGGVVGILAAAARPGRIDGIVAVNTFAWTPDRPALRGMLTVMGSGPAIAVLGSLGVVPRMSQTRFGVGRHLDRAGRRAFTGPYRDVTRTRNFHRAMGSARRSPGLFAAATDVLASELVDRPVLTVFGERNDPFGFADRWRELFPHARSWVVDGGNHFPMCDDPGGFARELRTWHATQVRPAATVTDGSP